MSIFKKNFVALILCFSLILTANPASTKASETTSATPQTYEVPEVEKTSDAETLPAFYTEPVEVEQNNTDGITSFFNFTVKQDSWVCLTGNYSLSNSNGGQTHVTIYTDSGYTHKLDEYGWGYWEYDNSSIKFLKKGTYYCTINTKYANFDSPFKGNVNVIGYAIPIDQLFSFKITTAKTKNYAYISIPDLLGTYTQGVKYQPGAVYLSKLNDNNYWPFFYSDQWFEGSKSCKTPNLKYGRHAFTARKNGSYTFMIQDTDGNRYSRVVKLTTLDSVKPAVWGVTNGKTYTSPVTIKFYDRGSHTKSAVLNGKAIKYATKISKAGSYSLVVTDCAGNKTYVKFTIK